MCLLCQINTTHCEITAGVLQGSGLGPTLFNICISDIPRTLSTTVTLYSAILAKHQNIRHTYKWLQSCLERCEWFQKRRRSKVSASESILSPTSPFKIILELLFYKAENDIAHLLCSRVMGMANTIPLYKIVLIPILLYGAPVWGAAVKMNIRKL